MAWGRVLFWTLVFGLAGWAGYHYFTGGRESKLYFPERGNFIVVEGARMHIRASGAGRVLLLLPGFPYTMDAYQEFMNKPWPGRRLLAVDLPGLGFSEKPASGALTPEALAMKIKLLLDKLEIREADIVGHDLGGGVALILAANYPLLVRHLILLAPDSSAGRAGDRFGWWWRLPGLGPAWTQLRVRRGWVRKQLQEAWAINLPDWKEWVETYYLPLDSFESRQNYYEMNRGRRLFDYLPCEERIQAPALVLWGEKDRVLPASKGRELLRHLNSANLQVLPGCGHLLLEEAPEAVYKAVKNFLDADDGPSSR